MEEGARDRRVYAWLVKKIETGPSPHQSGVTSRATMLLLRGLRCLLLLGCVACLLGLLLAVAILGIGYESGLASGRAAAPSPLPRPLQPLNRQRSEDQLSVEEFEWQKQRLRNDSTPLANWLLSQEESPAPTKTVNSSSRFIILVWEYGPMLERRHLKRFTRNKVGQGKSCEYTPELKFGDVLENGTKVLIGRPLRLFSISKNTGNVCTSGTL